jgi:hypothetical protein
MATAHALEAMAFRLCLVVAVGVGGFAAYQSFSAGSRELDYKQAWDHALQYSCQIDDEMDKGTRALDETKKQEWHGYIDGSMKACRLATDEKRFWVRLCWAFPAGSAIAFYVGRWVIAMRLHPIFPIRSAR